MEVQTRAADAACSILRRERSIWGNESSGESVKAAMTDGQEEGDETLRGDDGEDDEDQAMGDAEYDSDEFLTADE